MALIDLPTELLLGVWHYLEEEHDMNRLVQTCRRLYAVFNAHLYHHNVCHGGQAIPWAAEHGRKDTLQKLLDQGAAQIIYYDEWPLFTAAEHGQTGIIEMLLDAGNTPDMKDDRNNTALFHAAKGGHVDTIKLLLTKGAEVNALNNRDESPVRWTIKHKHPEGLTVLLDHGADCDRIESNYTALIYAAKNCDKDAVNIVLARTKAINTPDSQYNQTALMWAAENGPSAFRIVKAILDAGADIHAIDTARYTALSHAVKSNARRVVAMLLKRGADPDSPAGNGKTCLIPAAVEGNTKIVNLLLANGATPDIKVSPLDRTPLAVAAENGEHGVLRILLKKGVDVEARDKEGQTPLAVAARGGSVKCVHTLLEHGAKPNTVDNSGMTPLAWAARKENLLAVQRLLKVPEVLVSTVDDEGKTPLHYAVTRQHVPIVRALLRRGADPTIRDNKHRTPLSIAAEHGYTKVALALLDDGTPRDSWSARVHTLPEDADADCPCPSGRFIRGGRGRAIDLADDFGRRPLFFATIHAHENIVRALLARGSAAKDTPTTADRTAISVAAEHKNAAISHREFYSLQYIWQWLRYPAEACVDMKLVKEASSFPGQIDETDYPWCDNCGVHFYPYHVMYHCGCNGDNYDLCAECIRGGVKCLDETHEPEEREVGWR